MSVKQPNFGVFPRILARHRVLVAESMQEALCRSIDTDLDAGDPAESVDLWILSIGHAGAPELLTDPWRAELETAGLGADHDRWLRRLDAIARVVRLEAPVNHARWMLYQLDASVAWLQARRQRELSRLDCAAVVAQAVSGLDGQAPAVQSALTSLLSSPDEVSLRGLFERIVIPNELEAGEWRGVWRRLDGGIAASVGRWPHAYSASLRVLAQSTDRYEVLRRLGTTLMSFSSIWGAVLERTLVSAEPALRDASRGEGWSFFDVPEPNAAVNLTRDGLLLVALDLERRETDPVEDAGEWVSAQQGARIRAKEIMGRQGPALRRLGRMLGEGLPTEHAEMLAQFVHYLVCLSSRASVCDDPEAMFLRSLLLAVDVDGPYVARHRECLFRFAALLDPDPDTDLAELAREGADALDRARALDLDWAGSRRDQSAVGASDLGALGHRLGANVVWLSPERAALDAVHSWARRTPHSGASGEVLEGVAAWSRARDTDPERVGFALSRVEVLACEALAAVELGMACASLTKSPRAEWTSERKSLLWEMTWQLWTHAPDPSRRIWEEWSPSAEALPTRGQELETLVSMFRALLSGRTSSLCVPVLRGVFERNTMLATELSSRSLEPVPYEVRGVHWRACFGAVSRDLPELDGGVMPVFLQAMASTGDAEFAALLAADDETFTAPAPEEEPIHSRVWRSVHRRLVARCSLDLSVARALQVGHASVASEIALAVATDGAEQSRCIKEQFAFLHFMADRILVVPASLAALDIGRYLVMVLAPASTMHAREWSQAFTVARGALSTRLGRRERLAWARWCEQLLAMSEGLAMLGGTADLFHGSELVFSESSEEDALWRNLVGGLLAAAVTGPSAPVSTDALIQRLVLSDPLLGRETSSSWMQRAKVLAPFLAELVPAEWTEGMTAAVDAIGVALRNVEQASSQRPRVATTSAQVLSSVAGVEGRWRADRLLRHHTRRGVRDPVDLSVTRATGWALNSPEQIDALVSRIGRVETVVMKAPRAEGGGLFRFLRGESAVLTGGDPGKSWLFRAMLEDYLGSSPFERRQSLLDMQIEAGGVAIPMVVDPAVEASGQMIRDRREEVAMASLASKMGNVRQLAKTWVECASVPGTHAARVVRDVIPLLEQVALYANGVSAIEPRIWYASVIRPFVHPSAFELWTSLLNGADRHLVAPLGPDARTLHGLLQPLSNALTTPRMEAG